MAGMLARFLEKAPKTILDILGEQKLKINEALVKSLMAKSAMENEFLHNFLKRIIGMALRISITIESPVSAPVATMTNRKMGRKPCSLRIVARRTHTRWTTSWTATSSTSISCVSLIATRTRELWGRNAGESSPATRRAVWTTSSPAKRNAQARSAAQCQAAQRPKLGWAKVTHGSTCDLSRAVASPTSFTWTVSETTYGSRAKSARPKY